MSTKGLDIAITGLGHLVQRMKQAPTATIGAIGRGLNKGALVLLRESKRLVYAGHEEHLEGDTGHLRQSITYEVDEANYEANIGTNVIYAPAQEFGATITPKGHPYLAIPIGDMKGSPREHGDLFFLPTGDEGVLLDRAGNLQYSLKRSVTIPPRPWFGPAIDNKGQAAADEVVNAVYEVLAP